MRISPAGVVLVLNMIEPEAEALDSVEDGLLKGVGNDPDLVPITRVYSARGVETGLEQMHLCLRESSVSWGKVKEKGIVLFSLGLTMKPLPRRTG